MNIIALAMTLLKHRDSIAKIIDVLPELQKIFSALQPDRSPPPLASTSEYPVGSMEWLQDSLNTLADAGLEIDGEYGPQTKDAITEYQQANSLTADGWAGPETVAKIVEQLDQ